MFGVNLPTSVFICGLYLMFLYFGLIDLMVIDDDGCLLTLSVEK